MDTALKKKTQLFMDGFRREMHRSLPRLGIRFNAASYPSGVVIRFALSGSLGDLDHFEGQADTLRGAFDMLGGNIAECYDDAGDLAQAETPGYAPATTDMVAGDAFYFVAAQNDQQLSHDNGKNHAVRLIGIFHRAAEKDAMKKRAQSAAEDVFRKAEERTRRAHERKSWLSAITGIFRRK